MGFLPWEYEPGCLSMEHEDALAELETMHHEIKEIYAMLDRIMLRIEHRGYVAEDGSDRAEGFKDE